MSEARSLRAGVALNTIRSARAIALIGCTLALPFCADALADARAHPMYDKGVAAYKQFCSHCHGPAMVNPGTSSYDLRKWPTDRQQQFYTVLRDGKGSMPAWGDILLPDEMDALWVYVGSRGGNADLPPLDGLLSEPTQAPDAPVERAPTLQDPQDEDRASLDRKRLNAALLEPGTLRVCLARNGRAMSGWRQDGGTGFDYAVSAWLAGRLELALAVTWAEPELEEESDPVRENYAMLAAGWCDVVPGHPSYEGAMGEPVGPRAALPRLMGARSTSAPAPQVDLEPVRVSHPYLRVETGIVYRDGTVRDGHAEPLAVDDFANGLEALHGLDVGIEQGTLAGLLTRRQAPADVVRRSSTQLPGPAFLWLLESGAFDAALVDVPAYDFHLRQNTISTLRLADWRHPLAFNVGMAVLARQGTLAEAIDAVLHDARAEATLAALASEQGLHWAPPREPLVQGRFTLESLIGTDRADERG